MDNMEHAIEQAAQVMWKRDNPDLHPAWVDRSWEDAGESGERADYELRARALAEAGLLAPAPLREEWATRFPNGYMRPGKDMPYDSWWKGDPPKGVNVRHYVSDWLPADPAEGDGRADQ